MVPGDGRVRTPPLCRTGTPGRAPRARAARPGRRRPRLAGQAPAWYPGVHNAPRPTTPRMGDQAVPAGRDRSAPRRGSDHVPVAAGAPRALRRPRRPTQLAAWIGDAKAALGSRLLILGHHYQRDEVMRWADARGDSFGLSRIAADRRDADYIVFCGVHFMAESADILTAPTPAGDPPRPQRRLLDGRHGRHRLRRGGLGVTGHGDRHRARSSRSPT